MDGKTKEQFRGIREAIQSGKVFQPMGMAAAKEKIQKHLNDNSKPEKDAARKTAEYWKAEHLAGNAIIETLNARIAELERQVVSGDYDYTVDEICNAYESGVGHRGRPTAHVNPYKPGSDLATAYAIGAVGDREAQVAAPAASAHNRWQRSEEMSDNRTWQYEPEAGSAVANICEYEGARCIRFVCEFIDPPSAEDAALMIAGKNEVAALRAELAELRALVSEPVAWMHNKRVDVIHTSVKSLLSDFAVNYGPESMHRPIDKQENYTIPLYAHPVPPAAVPEDVAKDAIRAQRITDDVCVICGGPHHTLDAAILAAKEKGQ